MMNTLRSQHWMPKLRSAWLEFEKTWAANPRLRLMSALIVLVVVLDVGLRWLDYVEASLNDRAQLQASIAQLKAQSRDPQKLGDTLEAAKKAETLASDRLIEARSEAIAQARLQDWMVDLTKQANAQVLNLNIGNARTAGKTAQTPAAGATVKPAATGRADIGEIPVTLVLRFTPDVFVSVLQAIEGGPWLARVETLSVRRADRRLEVGVVVPVRIKAGD